MVEELILESFGRHGYYKNEEVEIAVHKRLRMQNPDLYQDGIFTSQ